MENLYTNKTTYERIPVYETWLEYFKQRTDLSDKEKNCFIDTMFIFNNPIQVYTPHPAEG